MNQRSVKRSHSAGSMENTDTGFRFKTVDWGAQEESDSGYTASCSRASSLPPNLNSDVSDPTGSDIPEEEPPATSLFSKWKKYLSYIVQSIKKEASDLEEDEITLLALDTICGGVEAVYEGIGTDNQDWQRILGNIAKGMSAKSGKERQSYISTVTILQNIANGLRHAVDPVYHAIEMEKGRAATRIEGRKVDTPLTRSKIDASDSDQLMTMLTNFFSVLRRLGGDVEGAGTGASRKGLRGPAIWIERWAEASSALRGSKSALKEMTSQRDRMTIKLAEVKSNLSQVETERDTLREELEDLKRLLFKPEAKHVVGASHTDKKGKPEEQVPGERLDSSDDHAGLFLGAAGANSKSQSRFSWMAPLRYEWDLSRSGLE